MSRSRHSGFTLLEMLLAITIFAMVSLSAWQMLQGVMDAKSVSADSNSRQQEIDYAMTVIAQDFRQLVDRGVRFEGQVTEQSLFAGEDMLDSDDEAAAFIRLGWRNPGQRLPRSELQNVSYRLLDGVLERQHYYVLDPDPTSEQVTSDLLTGVLTLKFRYFQDGQWQEELGEILPQGVMILIELEDLGMIERHFVLQGKWRSSGEST